MAEDHAKVIVSTGNVEAEGENAIGILAMADQSGEKVAIDIEQGDVKAPGSYADGIVASAYNQGEVTIRVAGDVTAESGTGINLIGDSKGSTDILVEGTLSGENAVCFGVNDAAKSTTLTVWEAEGTRKLINASEEIENSFAAAINYIIKLAGNNLTNSNITTAKHQTVAYDETNKEIIHGDETTENAAYDYHTANENEEVTVSVSLQDDEVFEGIYYNDDGATDAEKNLLTVGNGLTAVANAVNTFTLKMQRGGGMLLGLKTHTHEYSEYVGCEKEPTCTETGLDVYKCKYCDAMTTKTVDAAPDKHNFSIDVSAKAATCEEAGYTAHKECSRCHVKNGDYQVIPAGHDFSIDVPAKAATCEEDGYTAHKKCSRCGEKNDAFQVIPAGHDFSVDVAAKAATCKEDGYTAHKECSRCGEKNDAYRVIPASHDFEDKLTSGEKTHWYACKNCDAKKDEAEHTPGTPVKENELLAKNGAVKSYEEVTYCTVCGAELSRETILGQDAIHNPNAGEADIAEYESMTGNDIDLNAIPMPMDVSSDDDDVKLDTLANCPDNLKETAKQELAALKRSGYKIDCGCVAWSKSGKTAACTLKLSEKDVPDGAQIFVNGAAVQAELKDGYYYFEITLPAVVVVAHK